MGDVRHQVRAALRQRFIKHPGRADAGHGVIVAPPTRSSATNTPLCRTHCARRQPPVSVGAGVRSLARNPQGQSVPQPWGNAAWIDRERHPGRGHRRDLRTPTQADHRVADHRPRPTHGTTDDRAGAPALSEEGVDQRLVEILARNRQLFEDSVRESDTAQSAPEAFDGSEAELARMVVAQERERLFARLPT